MRHLLSVFLLTMFVTPLFGRVFTSADGVRKIDASVISYDEESEIVKIRRKDGRIFESAISLFSAVDQTYVLRWQTGSKESYFIYGKEYPGHLQLLIKMLNAGGIGYGQTILYGPGYRPVVIGSGPTPFLAWVNGYDRLATRYNRFSTTGVTFDLVKDNWQARIAFRSGSRITTGVGGPMVMGGNFIGLPSVSGPILYQQPSQIVFTNGIPANTSVVILPRGPSPVYVNPFAGGVSLNGINGGFIGTSSGFSRRSGVNIRISR